MTYTPQTPLRETRHPGGFLVSQANGHLSIDEILVNGGHGRLQPGTILASAATTYAGTGAAGEDNTGNGTIGAIAITAPAIAGTYTVTLISDTEFTVTNPNGEPVPARGGTVEFPDDDGVVVGPGTVGEVFNSEGVGFLITAGSTAFVEGDTFTVAVTAAGGGWAPLASSTSGATGYGILYGVADTTNGPAPAAAVVRQAEVNLAELVWDASLTAAQQDAGLASLKTQGVIAR
ncbi:head decoration protein [Luteibacter aegosomatis]|uniref:head decoration protein n=1 Tax=Luteibacter aegosomatis TaxID=2911537 RepID=UPI001FF9CD59|nr:head decoration protein [Luteibacter aegosomatis]UPG86850.1 head decoration protein [Luteibacter aegosomatis]